MTVRRPSRKDVELGKRFTRRSLLLGGAQVGLVGVLVGRLHYLQVEGNSRYALLADENRITVQLVEPKRGRIYDRKGVLLADNAEELRVTIIPDLAGDVDLVLSELAKLMPIDPEHTKKIVRLSKRQSRNLPILVTNDVTWEQFAKINVLAPQLPGVQTEVGWQRTYLRGQDTGHIVGYVGRVERYEIAGDPVLRLPGIRVGKTGVESGFEARLRGRGGNVKYEVDARGRIIRKLAAADSGPGRDATISIDTALQKRVLNRLKGERRAACVVMNVRNGEVLAMASVPSFDPSPLLKGLSKAQWDKLRRDPDHSMTNRTVRGQYPPASTFKMVTALAALDAGLITPKTRFKCTGLFEYADSKFACWNHGGHGHVNLDFALTQSCDVYFYNLARMLGIKLLAAMARKMGLGQVYDCGIPEQKAGVIPDPDWKRGRFDRPWFGGETVLAGIGQGYVLTTPLQQAVMTARIATGRAVVPTLLKTGQGDVDVPEFKELDVKREHLELMRRGMWGVVNKSHGTGKDARLPLYGVQMSGKTGTAQVTSLSSKKSNSELAWEQRDHALFVGYAPANDPTYAVSVIVEHGGSGGKVAAPVARDVLRDVLLHSDDSPLSPKRSVPQGAQRVDGSGSGSDFGSALPRRPKGKRT